MNTTRIIMSAAISATILLAGCAGDFENDPSRGPGPNVGRAVESPMERNSAESEAMGPAQGQVPLVTVTTPTGKQDGPQVRTIVDSVRETLNPPVTSTTTTIEPTTESAPPPANVHIQQPHVDPVTGE